ncbi:MAG: hypothetical protein PHR82_10090 [Endomicrobiaceae bacterium]|nr:hypothetical protein [Endomicrobiaceae bacterium]
MKKIILFCLGLFFLMGCSKVADVIAPAPDYKIVEITAISPYALQLGLDANTQYNIYAKVTTLDGQDTSDSIHWSNSDGYCEFYNSASGTWSSTATSTAGGYIRIRSTLSARNKISTDGFCQFNLHTNVYPTFDQMFAWD